MDRRDFLRMLGGAAAVTAAGLVVPHKKIWAVGAQLSKPEVFYAGTMEFSVATEDGPWEALEDFEATFPNDFKVDSVSFVEKPVDEHCYMRSYPAEPIPTLKTEVTIMPIVPKTRPMMVWDPKKKQNVSLTERIETLNVVYADDGIRFRLEKQAGRTVTEWPPGVWPEGKA